MAWIYLAESEESHLPWKGLQDPLPIVRSTGSLNPYSCQDSVTGGCPLLLSGMTCDHLRVMSFLPELISSMGDSHVRISVLQEMERAWMESAVDYSLKLSDLQKKLTLRLCSSKMSQQLELADFEKSFEHLPIYGMTVDGHVFLPLRLEPHILEKDGSYWLTPKANETGESYETYQSRMKRNLSPKQNLKQRPGSLSMQLQTPQYWPTPMARDWKGTSGKNRKTQNLPNLVNGQLNPQWVEWLMGYPLEWTELDAWVIPWFQHKSEKLLKDSLETNHSIAEKRMNYHVKEVEQCLI